MKKAKLIVLLAGVALLTAAASAGAAWWLLQPKAPAGEARPVVDKREYRYVSLDKVIVMLRGQQGGPLTNYLAVDLVFKTLLEDEAATKVQLPLLRSIAVRSLSEFTLEQAGMLTVGELSAHLIEAYKESYSAESRPQPFAEVMIGKLIIE